MYKIALPLPISAVTNGSNGNRVVNNGSDVEVIHQTTPIFPGTDTFNLHDH